MIKLKNVIKYYGKKKVLKGIDLNVRKGEILGIIGNNGAGKTTMLKIIAGLKRNDKGIVSVFDKNPLENIEVKRQIGYMPEVVSFNDDITGRQFLNDIGTIFNKRKSDIDNLLNFCDLTDHASKQVRLYSKGMTQKIVLAQALINDPQLLLLDEPNSGIDPQGTRKIRELLQQLNKEGKTIVVSSHQLGELEKICTRVIFIKSGELVEELSLKDYKESFFIEFRGSEEKAKNILERFNITLNINNQGIYEVHIETTKKDELLKELCQNDLNILRVQPDSYNLEELFFKYVGT